MAKNIRSNYIKNLMVDKEIMDASLRESTKDALKDIVDEAVNKNLRSMILEASEDEYDEEEANPEKELETASTEKEDEEGKGDNPFDGKDDSSDDSDASDDTDSIGDLTDSDADADSEGDDEVWDSIEQYKDVDGEYDLTGMGSEDVVKVLRVMKPEDGIRVVKNGDGNITLTDDNTDTEYIIQIEADEPEEDNFEYEVELGDDVEESYHHINEYDSHVGYTDNYQKETAMTTPPNDEPADPKSTYSMDAGVPKGTAKPWAGKGDNSPFTKKVNEGEGCEGDECVYECDININEDSGEFGLADEHNSVTKKHSPKTSHTPGRESSVAGQRHKGTPDNAYSPNEPNSALQLSSIQRKAIQAFNENKQLKEIASQIKDRLAEACIINASLGKIIKLITENTTTREEKIDIVNRFNEAKSVSDANKLYETISRELKNSHPINNTVDNAINGQQLTEAKKTAVVETSMYQSDDLAATRDFMDRLAKIK